MKPIHLLALAGAVATSCAATAQSPFSFAATPGKLPKDIVPIQYAAQLTPDLANHSFLGAETIEIDVQKPTDVIMLNAVNLQIDAASLSGARLRETKLEPILDAAQQTLSFKLAQPLAVGRYQLALKFRGQINREGRGLFQVAYKVAGQDKQLIATTMEPSDARRLLPTWDEPSFRARFKLTVDVPERFAAYSNTPAEKTTRIDGGIKRVVFAATPPMPSYLLALAAGEFERSTAMVDGVEVGVVATAGKQASAPAVLAASTELLRYYNNYFGVPYPLAKLDHIAVPGGFNGAMENWGAIIYNDSALLADPTTTPEAVRRRIYAVNAHETAHQWFGNLVTMAWWDELWLNEGFASWMGSKAVEALHPDWRSALELQAGREATMAADALSGTHPIRMTVANEAQAAAAFDGITYGKGRAFLRMLEAYVGEDAFRKGMRTYMARHKYSNTTSADLWAALEKASGKPVTALATDWTTQPGFPLVSVAQSCENGKRKVHLTQQPYWLDAGLPGARLWRVPLQLGSVGGKMSTVLLDAASSSFELPSCAGALVLDPAGVGYFRVQYDAAGFDALAAQAAQLPDSARLKLLDDSWSLVTAGRTPLPAYLQLVGRLKDEPRLALWESVIAKFELLDRLAVDTPERAKLSAHVQRLLGPQMARLGWEERAGDSAEQRQLRYALATALANAGDTQAIEAARAGFARLLANPASVPPGAREFVLSVTGRRADQATYEALRKLYAATSVVEERIRYGRALASARDPALAAQTLEMARSGQVASQLVARTLWAVAHAEHGELVWKFVLANRDALLKHADAVEVNRVLPQVLEKSSNAADAELLETTVQQQGDADALSEARRVSAVIRAQAAQKALLLKQL